MRKCQQLEPQGALEIEARGSGSQKVLRLKPELRFYSTGSEEPETRLEQERKIPLPKCVAGLGDRAGQHCYHFLVECGGGQRWATAGGGRKGPYSVLQRWGLWSIPLSAPPAWAGLVSRAGTYYRANGPFPKE